MTNAILFYEQRKAFLNGRTAGDFVFNTDTGEFSETTQAVMRQARDNMKPVASSAIHSLSPDI